MRTGTLEGMGYYVMRFRNEEVLKENKSVISKIERHVKNKKPVG